MSTYTITVVINFPNGDTSQRPSVDVNCNENDVIRADVDTIRWTIQSNVSPSACDGLKLTGLTFYTDATRTSTYYPEFLSTGTNGGIDWNWNVTFDGPVTADTTLYYDLDFQDDTYSDMEWDPTLTVNKRQSSEAGAGA